VIKNIYFDKWRNFLFKSTNSHHNALQTQTILKYKTSDEWHLKWIHRTDMQMLIKMSFTGNQRHTFKTNKNIFSHTSSEPQTHTTFYPWLGPKRVDNLNQYMNISIIKWILMPSEEWWINNNFQPSMTWYERKQSK
jgi:hypothetical protein